ncbi:MAG TPA: TetR/AcrR family transcriptional regulator [Cytophagaceae bacterium]|jgi:TetR/AcrR family transcriptional regulator|nr:TetR/AcrR family transcriptional regulator [Cytophagaceae bacterium]
MSPKNIEEEISKIDNVLNAAQKRFGQFGLCKTTMTEIASDIGLSKAALYYYYPDKESLFEAVIRKEQKEFVEEITKLIKSASKAPVLLSMYLKKRQDYFEKFMNLSKLKYDSIMNSKPLFGKLFEAFNKKERELVRTILEFGISNKEFKKMNTQENADFLINLLQGLRFIALKKQDDLTMNDEERTQLDENLKKTMNMFIRDISI